MDIISQNGKKIFERFDVRNGSDGRALAKYTLAKQVVTGSIPGVSTYWDCDDIYSCLLD